MSGLINIEAVLKAKAISDFEWGRYLTKSEFADYLKTVDVQYTDALFNVYTNFMKNKIDEACEYASILAEVLE